MKKILLQVLMILTLLTASFTASAKNPQTLTIMLDDVLNPNHAPLIVAEQQGFFKEQGLTVTLMTPHDLVTAQQAVISGKTDVGITYEPKFIEQVDQGIPLIRIGTLIDKPLSCVVALKDSGIKTLSDLKGKRIAATNNNITNIVLNALLQTPGLNNPAPAKNAILIKLRANLAQALLSKKVDAVTGIARNVEVPQFELNEQKITVFFPEEHGIPTYSELIFVTSTKNKHDPRLPLFLAALKKAVAYLDAHPDDAWQSFAKQYPSANNAVNRETWFTTLPYFAEDPASFDRNEWEQFARFLHKQQVIKKVQPISRYAVVV